MRPLYLWFALLLVGHAVALRCILAGPLVRYQHYRSPGSIWQSEPILLIVLALQAAVVAVGYFRARGRLPARRPAAIAAALVAIATGAAPSADPRAYALELLFAGAVMLVNAANLVLAVRAAPDRMVAAIARHARSILGDATATPPRLDPFTLAAAGWVVVVAALLNVVSYERHPHVSDEVSYLIQAHSFASGMLTMPAPPVPEAFQLALMTHRTDRWYSPFPPGWPAVLALGVLAGAPWLVNPLLAGLSVLVASLLFQRFFDRRTARIALLLLCTSPWFLFLSMSFMSHAASLLAALIASWAVARMRGGGGWMWGAAAGLAIGWIFLIRPLEGVVAGVFVGAWSIWGARRREVPALAAMAAVAAGCVAVHLGYNQRITGEPLYFPVMEYFDLRYGVGSNAMGFGPNRGVGWPIDPNPTHHSPSDAVVNGMLNTFSLNVELFGWSTGSLWPLVLAALAGSRRRLDLMMLLAILLVVVGHAFYWFSGGPDFGARYWYLVLPPAIGLCARGIRALESDSPDGPRVLLATLLLCTLSIVNYLPWRATDKYRRYLRMSPLAATLAPHAEKDIVWIRGLPFPDYASAAVYNSVPPGRQGPVYVLDGPESVRERVRSAFPGRREWIVEGPSVTRDGFRLVGPAPTPGGPRAQTRPSDRSPGR